MYIQYLNSLGPSDAYMRRKLSIIGSDDGLSPGRWQAMIWINAEILLIGTLGIIFSEILKEFMHFHSRKFIWRYRLRNGGHFVQGKCVEILQNAAGDGLN